MTRPASITDDLISWIDNIIAEDDLTPDNLKIIPEILEILRASTWLGMELYKAECSLEKIFQFKYALGQNCSGGKEPWEQATLLLEAYKNNNYEVELES